MTTLLLLLAFLLLGMAASALLRASDDQPLVVGPRSRRDAQRAAEGHGGAVRVYTDSRHDAVVSVHE